MCFYSTQPDILLCGITRGNKNKLRTFQPQKWKKIKNSRPQTKFTGSYKKKSVVERSSGENPVLQSYLTDGSTIVDHIVHHYEDHLNLRHIKKNVKTLQHYIALLSPISEQDVKKILKALRIH